MRISKVDGLETEILLGLDGQGGPLESLAPFHLALKKVRKVARNYVSSKTSSLDENTNEQAWIIRALSTHDCGGRKSTIPRLLVAPCKFRGPIS